MPSAPPARPHLLMSKAYDRGPQRRPRESRNSQARDMVNWSTALVDRGGSLQGLWSRGLNDEERPKETGKHSQSNHSATSHFALSSNLNTQTSAKRLARRNRQHSQ